MPAIKWVRPSGSIIETNDSPDTIAAAKALGWALADGEEQEKSDAPRRGRPPKNRDPE